MARSRARHPVHGPAIGVSQEAAAGHPDGHCGRYRRVRLGLDAGRDRPPPGGHRPSRNSSGPRYAVYALPAREHDRHLWAQGKESETERFGDRDPKNTIDQGRACLDVDCRETLGTRPIPLRVTSFSDAVQTAPAMCKVVCDPVPNGTFHLIEGHGHVSRVRHKPDVLAAKLREISSPNSSRPVPGFRRARHWPLMVRRADEMPDRSFGPIRAGGVSPPLRPVTSRPAPRHRSWRSHRRHNPGQRGRQPCR
jgi:hypothetical protein